MKNYNYKLKDMINKGYFVVHYRLLNILDIKAAIALSIIINLTTIFPKDRNNWVHIDTSTIMTLLHSIKSRNTYNDYVKYLVDNNYIIVKIKQNKKYYKLTDKTVSYLNT